MYGVSINFRDWFFSSQFKRWDKVVEAYPVLGYCNDAELDAIDGLLRACFQQSWIEGAKSHPNKNAEDLWNKLVKEAKL